MLCYSVIKKVPDEIKKKYIKKKVETLRINFTFSKRFSAFCMHIIHYPLLPNFLLK